jgi:hypothetical protein
LAIKAGVAVIAVLGGSLAAVGGVIVPLKIAAVFTEPRSAVAEPQEAMLPPTQEQAVVAEGLRRLLASAGALIAEHPAGAHGPAHIVLWRDGASDRGSVNESELVVIAHNPLLMTLSAYSHEEPGAASAVVPAQRLFSDALFATWRLAPGVGARVVATDVTDARFEWRQGDGGEGELGVRLIWGGAGADGLDEAHRPQRAAAFSVTLPRVQRAR